MSTRQLAELPAAAGVGVVAAPGVVAGHERHLEWWQRGGGTGADAGAGGQFLGVAGADVAMSHFEPGLLAILRSAPSDTVLVTAERRVLAANTPRWIAGARLGRLPAAGAGTFSAAAEVGADSGWVLAVAAPG